MNNPDWPLANCAGVNPELMHPDRHSTSEEIAAARAVCDGCVIREECLEYALVNGEKRGIWGGSTPNDRRLMWRERKANA